MPDDNKFKKLREIGYSIKVTCGTCKFGGFSSPRGWWGTCAKHTYQHLKHDNPEGGRGISVVRAGSCSEGVLFDGAEGAFGAHAEFIKETP